MLSQKHFKNGHLVTPNPFKNSRKWVQNPFPYTTLQIHFCRDLIGRILKEIKVCFFFQEKLKSCANFCKSIFREIFPAQIEGPAPLRRGPEGNKNPYGRGHRA